MTARWVVATFPNLQGNCSSGWGSYDPLVREFGSNECAVPIAAVSVCCWICFLLGACGCIGSSLCVVASIQQKRPLTNTFHFFAGIFSNGLAAIVLGFPVHMLDGHGVFLGLFCASTLATIISSVWATDARHFFNLAMALDPQGLRKMDAFVWRLLPAQVTLGVAAAVMAVFLGGATSRRQVHVYQTIFFICFGSVMGLFCVVPMEILFRRPSKAAVAVLKESRSRERAHNLLQRVYLFGACLYSTGMIVMLCVPLVAANMSGTVFIFWLAPNQTL
jgi:hypothetical protein